MSRRSGYTLLEVLVALGIFVVGFTAAASIFPVAALLQKRTMSDVEGKIVARNAENMLRGRGLTYDPVAGTGNLANYYTPGASYDQITPFSETGSDLAGLLNTSNGWSLNDRGYPTTVASASERDFVWFPLVRDSEGDSTNPNWTFYIFILSVDGNATYPNPAYENTTSYPSVDVFSSFSVSADKTRFNFTNSDGSGNLLVSPGDSILDNNGVIYNAFEADASGIKVQGLILTTPNPPTQFYYATRPDEPESDSSVRSIITLGDDNIVTAP